MGNDVRAFPAKIRPASNRKTREPTGPYSITNMLKRVGMIRKVTKKTRPHTIVGGWYMHGKKAGEPRPGRRAAMIRAYEEKALAAYKRPSSKDSSLWMAAAKAQRGRGLVGSVLGKQLLSGIGKDGKNTLKQALLRNAVPTYRLLANRGESLLKDYVQRKQRGKGIWPRLKFCRKQ